ncbi:MAG: mechanosensitive ion channel [Alphaproteobacteria bacterium]|nr:mechanosensitive ion channel [Alphaproteobacteria bacterium]
MPRRISGATLFIWVTLVLLLQGGAVAAAEAPAAGPSVVLQLPPTMTADEVKQVLGDLAAKGATLAPPPAPAPVPQGSLVWRIIDRLIQAAPATSGFLDIRSLWHEAMAQEGRPPDGTFWLLLFGLVAAALAVEFLIRTLLPALVPGLRVKPGMTLFRAFGRHALTVALGVCGFLVVIRSGAGFLGQGSALLTEIRSRIADGAADWRIAMGLLTALAAPGLTVARPLLIVDDGARALTRWVSFYLVAAVVLVTGVWVAGRLGGGDMELMGGLAIGLALLIYKIAMFFRMRAPVGAAVLAAGGDHPSPGRQFAAASWHWFFIAMSMVVFLLAIEEFALGNNTRAGVATTALQTVIVAFAMIWAAKRRFVAELARLGPGRWWLPVASRAIDVTLLLGSALWLVRLFGYDVLDPAAGSFAETMLRPLFKAATTLAVAWLVWATVGGFLRGQAPSQALPGDEDEPELAGVTRLATLLPLIRTVLAIAIFFLGVVIALGDLGVNIGPLLAGAGVVGLALGFGAQALVRDVIAGLFFLIDDAFRIGEYIDTGRLKGTVEAISIRSVRLRHQNGQVHTIPFGLIQAVTNFSRDWAIVKFNLHVAPNTDLELVRKTLKQLGQSLLEDPEIGGDFIQPLKLQGVADVTQEAIMIRCKFTALPIRPSYLRRQALREIIKRFAAVGIAFATPPVNASNPL